MNTPAPTKDTPETTPAPLSEEALLFRELRGERSYREFETYMNEKIPTGMPGATTFMSIWNWENGVHKVTDTCLLAWTMFYTKSDKRFKLAQSIIALRHRSYEKASPEEIEKQDEEKILEAVKTNTKGEE